MMCGDFSFFFDDHTELGGDVLTEGAGMELMIFSRTVLVYMSNLCFTSFSLFRVSFEIRSRGQLDQTGERERKKGL